MIRITADYIHLNPARAGLAGGTRGPLVGYRWSSLAAYERGNGPAWLEMERLLRAFELAEDGRGRRAYVAWLEARAASGKGDIDAKAMDALRQGWFLGEDTFRDRLLALVDRAGGVKPRARRIAAGVLHDHGEREAERLVVAGAAILGLPATLAQLASISKGDERKALLAALIRRHAAAGTQWLAKRLGMGHPGSVSRLIGVVRDDQDLTRKLKTLEKMLFSGD